jgi:hypothetical protein
MFIIPGTMPAATRKSVVFDRAIGQLPELIDWWSAKDTLVKLDDTEAVEMFSRRMVSSGELAGNKLVKATRGPTYYQDQVNGKPAFLCNPDLSIRATRVGSLPTGNLSIATIFRSASSASVQILGGTQSSGARAALFTQQTSGVDQIVATFGEAGANAATAAMNRTPNTWNLAIASFDVEEHEAAISVNGGPWTRVVNEAAERTNTAYGISGYANADTGLFHGYCTDHWVFGAPLASDDHAEIVDLLLRYARTRYALEG